MGACQDLPSSPVKQQNAAPGVRAGSEARRVAESNAVLLKRATQYQEEGRSADAEKLLRQILSSLERAILTEPLKSKRPTPPGLLCKAPPNCVGMTCSAIGEALGVLVMAASPVVSAALSVADSITPYGARTSPGKVNSEITSGVMKTESGRRQKEVCKEQTYFLADSDGLVPLVLNETLVALGNTFATQKKFAEAETYYRRALASREEVLGREHPAVAPILEKYAALMAETGREGPAGAMRERARAIRAMGPR